MFKLREGDFMVYEIKKIAGRSDLKRCHSFEISNFQWRSIYRPRARGCVGYIENKGFLVWLACEELHPKADCVRNYEPICMDSALVAFFRFDRPVPNISTLLSMPEVPALPAMVPCVI